MAAMAGAGCRCQRSGRCYGPAPFCFLINHQRGDARQPIRILGGSMPRGVFSVQKGRYGADYRISIGDRKKYIARTLAQVTLAMEHYFGGSSQHVASLLDCPFCASSYGG